MKIVKEKEKDSETLAKENKRLQILIIIFMIIALCLGTFYFNVICYGAGCPNKTLKQFNFDKTNNNVTINQNDEEKIRKGYWYNDGILFFFNSGIFTIGRYGTDGGYNGIVGVFKKIDNSNIYEFDARHRACTENCIAPSNNYTLAVNLEYSKSSTGETVTIKSMKKIEEGNSEELTAYEKIYQFAGNSLEEVETYVNNLNN